MQRKRMFFGRSSESGAFLSRNTVLTRHARNCNVLRLDIDRGIEKKSKETNSTNYEKNHLRFKKLLCTSKRGLAVPEKAADYA